MDQYLVHVNPGDTLAGRERWPVSLAATSAASGAEYGIVGVNEGIISIEVFPTSIELVKVSLRRTRLLGAKIAPAVF